MRSLKYCPGDYRVDKKDYQFVLCKKTGLYYGHADGITDFSDSYESLNELMRSRHWGVTKTSGKQRAFSVKSKIRILNVLLTEWEDRGECFAPALMRALFR